MSTTATEAPASARVMRERDLLDFTWIADPQISPDGTRVAFTRVTVDSEEDRYLTQLWIAGAAGGEPRPLTSGTRDSSPRWSPDGTSIAFVRVAEAEKPGQIWVLPMDGGEAAARTALVKGACAPSWSPDGKRIVFSSGTNPALDDPEKKKPKNEPARVVTRPVFRENNAGFVEYDHRDHVWVVDAAGGTPRPLTHGEFSEEAPRFSRDGKHVLFLSDRRAEPWFGDEHSAIYAVPADLAEPTDGARMVKVFDPAGLASAFAEGADGRLAVIASRTAESPRSFNQADLRIAEGPWPMREAMAINPGARYGVGEEVNSDQHPPRAGGPTPLAWLAGGKAVLARVAREGSSRLARFDLASGEVTELTPAGDLVNATATPDGRRWALVLGNTTTPGELHGFDAETGTLTKLWAPNAAALAGTLGTVEEFWYDSFDGQRIQAWLVKPAGFDPAKKYPLILEIHGGPHTAYGHGFFHEFHVLAGAGYLVLYTNPRGSTSYGQEFANVIQYRFPGDDARDLIAGVDAVVKRGIVDEKRIGVTGGSGGGLLTNWLIAHEPAKFAAAVTQRCVSSWAGMYESCDFAMFFPYWFRKPPHEDAAEWAERSPMTYVKNIRTPLMIVHSEEDWRTPIAQGEALFRALLHLRRTVVMVRFPGENHELSRSGAPSRRVQNQEHIRAWFDRWLMGKPSPQYGV